MSTIAVVIPTIPGRGEHYTRCVRAYASRSQHEIQLIAVWDQPTCGEAWNLGVEQQIIDEPDYLHFSADDLEPHEGWDVAAIEAVQQGALPAPRIVNPHGQLDSCGDHGRERPDWAWVQMSVIPFMSWQQWQRIGPVLPIHYFSDNWLSWRGLQNGYPTLVRRGYAFTHHWAQPGRGAGMTYEERMTHDRGVFSAAIKRGALAVTR